MPVRSLQHFAFAIPDLEPGRKFYTAAGLQWQERGGNGVLRCHERDQDQIILIEGAKKKRLHHIAFGTTAKELPELKANLEKRGVRLLNSPYETGKETIWFNDPDGRLIAIMVADAAPSLGGPEFKINSPGHYIRFGVRGVPPRDKVVRPRRLGHMILFSPNFEKQLAFYSEVLGMRMSDRAQNLVGFMRTAGDSDHHVVAFLAADKPGFHHGSFEVESIDDIGLAATRLLDLGYKDGWGFGRHVIGSNFFHYIRDPWNSLMEFFCDIDVIPDNADWEARNWDLEDSLFIWGPRPPEDFGFNYEAAS